MRPSGIVNAIYRTIRLRASKSLSVAFWTLVASMLCGKDKSGRMGTSWRRSPRRRRWRVISGGESGCALSASLFEKVGDIGVTLVLKIVLPKHSSNNFSWIRGMSRVFDLSKLCWQTMPRMLEASSDFVIWKLDSMMASKSVLSVGCVAK